MIRPGQKTNPFLSLWLQALASPNGIFIRIRPGQDISRVKSLLYAARNRSGNPELKKVVMRSRPKDPMRELWLIPMADEFDHDEPNGLDHDFNHNSGEVVL